MVRVFDNMANDTPHNLGSRKRPSLEGSFRAIALGDLLQLIGSAGKPCLVLTMEGHSPTGLIWINGNQILKALTPQASGIRALFLLWKRGGSGGFRVYHLPEGKIPRCELGPMAEIMLQLAFMEDSESVKQQDGLTDGREICLSVR